MRSYFYNFINFIYKWMPVIFGCHCKPERSFYYKNFKFPICARCTGELLGMIIAIITGFIFRPKVSILLLMLIPLIFDGFLQLLSKYESNNRRRLITGILFGYALLMLLLISFYATFQYGYKIGMQMK